MMGSLDTGWQNRFSYLPNEREKERERERERERDKEIGRER
jgi:hypothetical protein